MKVHAVVVEEFPGEPPGPDMPQGGDDYIVGRCVETGISGTPARGSYSPRGNGTEVTADRLRMMARSVSLWCPGAAHRIGTP